MVSDLPVDEVQLGRGRGPPPAEDGLDSPADPHGDEGLLFDSHFVAVPTSCELAKVSIFQTVHVNTVPFVIRDLPSLRGLIGAQVLEH